MALYSVYRRPESFLYLSFLNFWAHSSSGAVSWTELRPLRFDELVLGSQKGFHSKHRVPGDTRVNLSYEWKE
jgi:hypothetical protein